MTHKTPKIIKRYQNRKLYDTSDSCYVTLEDLGEMVKAGEEIQVIDNNTKEDLTSVTLAQIIFEEEKKKKNTLPLSTLTNIIRSGGETIKGFVQKSLESGAKEIHHLRGDLNDYTEKLFKRGSISQEDRKNILNVVKDFFDEKIMPTVHNVQNIGNVQSEIKSLRSKIDELERRLRSYERK